MSVPHSLTMATREKNLNCSFIGIAFPAEKENEAAAASLHLDLYEQKKIPDKVFTFLLFLSHDFRTQRENTQARVK